MAQGVVFELAVLHLPHRLAAKDFGRVCKMLPIAGSLEIKLEVAGGKAGHGGSRRGGGCKGDVAKHRRACGSRQIVLRQTAFDIKILEVLPGVGLQVEQGMKFERRTGIRQALQVDFISHQRGADIVISVNGSPDFGSEIADFTVHIHHSLDLALPQVGSEPQTVQMIFGYLQRFEIDIGLK